MNEKQEEWAVCPICGSKTVKYEGRNGKIPATCRGVSLKCTRGCKGVFELVIVDGVQIMTAKECEQDGYRPD